MNAGLRTVFNIAQEWGLSDAELQVLLGVSGRSTFYRWKKDLSATPSPDLLDRLSYILGIYKALGILLPIREHALSWIKRPNNNPLFGGLRPLDRMLGGGIADLFLVRSHLDASRGP